MASLTIVLQRALHLIFYPYKTMRRIAMEQDLWQIIIIFLCALSYFLFANILRNYPYHPLFLFFIFCGNFMMSVTFFYFGAKMFRQPVPWKPFFFTFTYTLIPTLVWFAASSALYALIPPPRTMSMLGKTFSLVFITFSISLLIWKIILWFLAVRFSTRLAFYRIMYLMLLYLCAFAPYTILLYSLKIFRVPFM